MLALPIRPGEATVAVLGDPPSAAGDLPALLSREGATGAAGEVVPVPLGAPIGTEGVPDRLLLVGIGEAGPAALRQAGAAVARRARAATELSVDLRGVTGLDESRLRAFLEGVLLASYGYTQKRDAEPRPLRRVTVAVAHPERFEAAARRAVVTATATAAARDLVNTPSLEKTPQWFADRVVRLLRGVDVAVDVLDETELARRGFGGLVGVGMGSARPPRLVEARYDGGGGRHVVLVGKGITFDTGGLSLKPTEGMVSMKTDMGGAAAVLATLHAAAQLGLRLRITALAALAENMIGGGAQRPGDVLTQYGGRTVEVLNTDAEGRLVLADALAYADRELAPDVIVDVATLTGAMPVALGRRMAGLFSSDDTLAAQLARASEESGEALWRLPLVSDYRSALDSPTADLRNIADPRRKLQGGSIMAALFLQEFTGGRPWAHLDIAGAARSDAEDNELSKGGTGYGVRLLVRWLEALAAGKERR